MRAPAEATEATASYRWVILGTVYLGFLAYAVAFQSIPPVLSLIIADLRLSHAQAGLLMSLFALPGVFLSIPVGALADRHGARGLTVLCLVGVIVGSLLAAAGRSFSVLALGRVVAGAGGLSLFVVGAQLVGRWFAGRELGTAVGIYSTAVPVGTIVSLDTFGAIARVVGWQGAVAVSAGLAAVALAAFLALYRPAPSTASRGRSDVRPSASSILGLGLPIWLVGAIWMLFNAAVIAFLTFGPDYFVARGYGLGFAGLLTSFVMLFSPVLGPLVGYLLDRADHDEAFVGLGGLLVSCGIYSVSTGSLPLVAALALLGVGAALVPTPVFTLPPKTLPARSVGVGYGIVSTCLNVGVVVGPYLAGVARDVTGSYRLSFDLMSLVALLVTLAAGALYLARRRAPTP